MRRCPAERPTLSEEWRGHAVLQLPVALWDGFVAARWRHYDPALMGAAGFTHAHVTVLGPVDPGVAGFERRVRRVLGEWALPVFATTRVDVFPNGVIYAAVEPAGPVQGLTAALAAELGVVPYAGRAPESVPHITLDALGAGVDVAGVRARVADLVGRPFRCSELELAWYETGRTRVLARWAAAQA